MLVNSKRFGLIGRKIGMHPLWFNDGTRVLCTLLEIPENHIISTVDPDKFYTSSTIGKRKAFTRFGPMWNVTVGAFNADSASVSEASRKIFENVGVPCKKKLASFLTTEDAVAEPGTVLDARHFQVGQFISVSGKTIDWGFQGGMHRWGFRGMPALGTTKSHRRIGSIGSKGDARVWPGKRMPGHMGYRWRMTTGLEILRINPLKQVIYVKGCVVGDNDEIVLLKDCYNEKKIAENPPLPTFVLGEDDVRPVYSEEDEELQLADIAKYDIYSESLFRFTTPSIVFTEKDEVKAPARDKSRAKIAKVKK